MIRLRGAVGRTIIARDSAQEIGRLTHVVVGSDARIHAITTAEIADATFARAPAAMMAAPLMSPDLPAQPVVLDWADIISFGPDAIVTSSASTPRVAASDAEERAVRGGTDLLNRSLLTDSGDMLGKIDDVEFDEGTGQIHGLAVGERLFGPSNILAIGPFAVIASERT